ncbi:C-terminal binding protein [Geodermatophilus sp. YIM 151500]|uniref:C-terminal binding protein n=1 Tax=Geodermatophilus sp. YIM 151500 TaxID=2984531 RepID=UPI0021E368F6|nr:C-terminal binding protein [Geodermatophilus sp. YIM 151500]MCV2488621.1 C-terminal binding protein [Geodermatophilus sp. YIM 151500]
MRVLVTDAEYGSLDLEADVLGAAGHELLTARCRTAADVIGAAQDVDAVIVQYAPISAEVLAALPRLRLVSRYGVGVDVVDLEAARARGVWVCNVPDYGTVEVALHAVAMLSALLRNLAGHGRHVREGRWDYRLGGPLRRPGGLTLGVVGLGRIGRMTMERAAPWFGDVVGHDPYLPDAAWPDGVERLGLEDLFARSHAVTLHLPLTAETQGLVGPDLLARMPAGSYLVNTARGGLVQPDAVLQALEDGRLAGVALDVLPEEPPPAGHALLGHPGALVTPHVAWYSQESEVELRRTAAENVVVWARTGRPVHWVVEGR